MAFVDKARITVKAGDGGNGAVVYVENEPTGCATLNITGGTFTGNKSTTGTGGVVYCGGN